MIVPLQSMAELETALRGPAPVMIFKHSTACPISAAAHGAFRRFVAAHPAGARYFLVKVIEQRALSGEIARRLGVPHASPQVLLWHRGAVRWHASHGAITEQSLGRALASLRDQPRVGRTAGAGGTGPVRGGGSRPGAGRCPAPGAIPGGGPEGASGPDSGAGAAPPRRGGWLRKRI
ncbi:bacillithiol system redox-active protein YtxJ [Thermaerobacter litoralis]